MQYRLEMWIRGWNITCLHWRQVRKIYSSHSRSTFIRHQTRLRNLRGRVRPCRLGDFGTGLTRPRILGGSRSPRSSLRCVVPGGASSRHCRMKRGRNLAPMTRSVKWLTRECHLISVVKLGIIMIIFWTTVHVSCDNHFVWHQRCLLDY